MAANDDRPAMSPLINIRDAAELLGVEVRHVRRLVHERRIPFVKWGHLIRFDPTEIASWVDEHRTPASHPHIAHPYGRPGR
jgi:excisionase family DNA binding protein